MPKPTVKRDKGAEDEAQKWIEEITGEKFSTYGRSYEDALKNGVLLCKLMTKLVPGSVKKVQVTGGGFQMMENIAAFSAAAAKFGVPADDRFQSVDLWEKKNIVQVTLCIHSLGRVCQQKPEYSSLPVLGVKMSTENKREWTEEQLKAGESHLGLQMGSNKGASQSGMSMGGQRHVHDIGAQK